MVYIPVQCHRHLCSVSYHDGIIFQDSCITDYAYIYAVSRYQQRYNEMASCELYCQEATLCSSGE
ncbi:uncharacterized protein BBOV_IV007965 [Babesia bovis T2Bo]|uniref:uncharacterized protein n=1 Tax=Babesia bovis T2Bo TaxID=484906 RepID=UPI001DFD4BDB|nr:uncharacterized protein BBOV_IV007965 [Babesia bovis T2Bo]KAG6439969.1 hypothetical protein BBOV_IV007965 [Babesia bovis T2Bo]